MGPLGTWERNELGKNLYFGDHYGTVLDILIGIPAVAGQIALLIVIVLTVLLGIGWCLLEGLSKLWKIMPKGVHTTANAISDISDSIKGKSCAKVNITNLPEPTDYD